VGDVARDHLTDRLRAVALRDSAALRDVYDLTSAKLFGVCLRILVTREEAEDVLQEVYLTVWHRADLFDAARSSPITWLVTIARNKAIDRLRAIGPRRADRSVDDELNVVDGGLDALTKIEHDQDHARLTACLDGLEPRTRDIIREAFFGGETYDALARRSGQPLGTVKSWVRRGLIALRECLER
jgi:RNA polymerase sigma factor (sigma-70 family)